MFDHGMRPDGVFAPNDLVAIGFLDRARLVYRLDAPQDFALVGFDDIPMAGWDGYGLTTIRLPVHRMAERVADLVDRMIADEVEGAEHTEIPCQLVRRRSA